MPTGVYQRKITIPKCHPESKHRAKGLCLSCYQKQRMKIDKNRQKKKECSDGWYQKNKERLKRKASKYYAHNINKCKRGMRAYREKHPEMNIVKHSKRRARKLLSGGSFTAAEWKALCKLHGNKCLCCGKRRKLAADHVIPVSKGGSSNIENIQPLCQPCNSRKGTKTTDYRRSVYAR
jgi:5-methylcytosine-specific restriction endonuclease McrA